MALGVLPRSSELPPLPPLSLPPLTGVHAGAHTAARAAGMTSAAGSSPVMCLMWPGTEKDGSKTSKVWIGDGLPTIPRKLYD